MATPPEVYTPAPVVSGVAPPVGSARGGTTVTISGLNFTGVTQVKFGDAPAAAFTVDSPTSISAVTPPHALGPVQVSVVNAGGTSAHRVPEPGSKFVFAELPNRVEDLVATAVSDHEVRLDFTAPDDGTGLHRASVYVVKQSLEPITAANFDAADALCTGGRCSFAEGERVSLTVGDLLPATTYHYAVAALGADGAAGEASKSVSATTLALSGPGGVACRAITDTAAGQLLLRGGRYHLVSAPEGSVIGSTSPLYGWMDLGAGGAYSVEAPTTPVSAGRGYWAWSACDRLVELANPSAAASSASFPLGAYHASMVGNPSPASSAQLTGHDFAATWDPDANGGAGAYVMSGYRQSQPLAVGQAAWAFSYGATTLTIAPQR